jgi:hypothetical protein
MSEALDFQQVLREIDEEVRTRRASGDFPSDMERELDLVFARFAPVTVNGDDLPALLEAAERTSLVNANPPTSARLLPVSVLKKVEHKLLGWFFRYVAQQVTAFGGIVNQVLRLLSRRLEAVEAMVPGANAEVAELARRSTRPATAGGLTDQVVAHVAGARGRVLVAEAGDGDLLRACAAGGVDAYGIDARTDRAESLALSGLEVRDDDSLDHLRVTDEGTLAGVVLVGVVDRAPLGTKVALLAAAARALAPGGRIAVVGTDPAAWGAADPVEADLAPGRPLHAETWAHLLAEHGFSDVRTAAADGRALVTAAR